MENIELKKVLEVYKKDTLDIIASLERNDFDALEGLINKRQQTFDSTRNIEYTKEEFTEIVEELEILALQKKLSDLMLEKRTEVKKELNKISSAKSASNMYNKNVYSNSMVFNKTI